MKSSVLLLVYIVLKIRTGARVGLSLSLPIGLSQPFAMTMPWDCPVIDEIVIHDNLIQKTKPSTIGPIQKKGAKRLTASLLTASRERWLRWERVRWERASSRAPDALLLPG